ncbi:hypothetical protein G9A89_009017 [Geosiphon pyriformis]|nr:hypothetical protein G9A89_009017 [Geosiphon pyriformis]
MLNLIHFYISSENFEFNLNEVEGSFENIKSFLGIGSKKHLKSWNNLTGTNKKLEGLEVVSLDDEANDLQDIRQELVNKFLFHKFKSEKLFPFNLISKMRAIVIKDKFLKSIDELLVSDDVPEPVLEKGHVLVEVHAISLNFLDILMVQGKYQIKPPFPFIPGVEFAGTVLKAHSDTPTSELHHFKPGDRVFGTANGTFSERVSTPSSSLLPIPAAMSFEEAAGLYITYPTSYAALVLRANLRKGEWCLVHAGAGGVGVAAVQIAKVLGANVIATGGSDDKLAVALRNGADYVINYKQKNWLDQVKKFTGGHGVDVVYDPVGLIEESMKCIAWNGRLLVIGFAGGNIEKVAMNRVLLKNCTIMGVYWNSYEKFAKDTFSRVWDALFHLFRGGMLRPIIYHQVYDGLEFVKDGLKALEGRHTYGKIVIRLKEGKDQVSYN